MNGVGKKIKGYREAAGLKQEELAEIVDLSPNHLSAIERDVKTPKLETFIRIVNALNVTADEILVDVIDNGIKTRYTQIEERLSALPQTEQKKIMRILDTMIEEAKN